MEAKTFGFSIDGEIPIRKRDGVGEGGGGVRLGVCRTRMTTGRFHFRMSLQDTHFDMGPS
jgi:hypothetical protein